jgi:hypothetical protein
MAACDGIGRSLEWCATEAIIAELEEQYPGKVEITTQAKEAQANGKKTIFCFNKKTTKSL